MDLEIALEASLLVEDISASMRKLEAILDIEGTSQQKRTLNNAVQALTALNTSMKGMNLRMADHLRDAKQNGHPSTQTPNDG